MNTKLIMTSSALISGATGLILTFAPEILLDILKIEITQSSILLVQVIGGLYLGYSMLNWMARKSRIGGDYNIPIVVANFTHFLIVGLAIGLSFLTNDEFSIDIWSAGAIYLLLGFLFVLMLFGHPISSLNKE